MPDRERERLADAMPPMDSDSLVFDLADEMKRTLQDLIIGREPSTILGVIMAHPNGVAAKEIAETLDAPVGLVGWNVEKLEEEDWCVRFVADGVRKVLPIATRADGELKLGYRTATFDGPSLRPVRSIGG